MSTIGGHIQLIQGVIGKVDLALLDSAGVALDITDPVEVEFDVQLFGVTVLTRTTASPPEIVKSGTPTDGLATVNFTEVETAALETGSYTYNTRALLVGVGPQSVFEESPLSVVGKNALVWGEIVALAPELSTLSGFVQSAIVVYINDTFSATAWGGDLNNSCVKLARAFYGAHIGAMTKRGQAGAAGAISSKSAGGLSLAFGASGVSDETSLSQTSYGQVYLGLLRTSPARLPCTL